MNRSYASGLSRLSPADMLFIESVLAPGSQGSALRQLCDDPSVLEQILDLKALHQAVIGKPTAICLSAGLYFYILVRHAFLDAHIDDRKLADYVAGVLAQKVSARPDPRPGSVPGWITYAVDFISIIESTSGQLKFHLQVEAGNQFLLLTGIFPEFLEHRAAQTGAPGVDFYEDFARNAYRQAASSTQAPVNAPRQLFGLLSEVFPDARRSLNKMTEHCLFIAGGF